MIHIVKLIECHDACSFVNAVYYVQSSNVVIFCSSMHLSKKINNKAVFGWQKSVEAMARGKFKMPVNYLFFSVKIGFRKVKQLKL